MIKVNSFVTKKWKNGSKKRIASITLSRIGAYKVVVPKWKLLNDCYDSKVSRWYCAAVRFRSVWTVRDGHTIHSAYPAVVPSKAPCTHAIIPLFLQLYTSSDVGLSTLWWQWAWKCCLCVRSCLAHRPVVDHTNDHNLPNRLIVVLKSSGKCCEPFQWTTTKEMVWTTNILYEIWTANAYLGMVIERSAVCEWTIRRFHWTFDRTVHTAHVPIYVARKKFDDEFTIWMIEYFEWNINCVIDSIQFANFFLTISSTVGHHMEFHDSILKIKCKFRIK